MWHWQCQISSLLLYNTTDYKLYKIEVKIIKKTQNFVIFLHVKKTIWTHNHLGWIKWTVVSSIWLSVGYCSVGWYFFNCYSHYLKCENCIFFILVNMSNICSTELLVACVLRMQNLAPIEITYCTVWCLLCCCCDVNTCIIHWIDMMRIHVRIPLHQLYKGSGDSLAARGGNLAKIPPNQVIADFGRGSSVESESEWCPAGIIERFELFKIASKMATLY